MNVMYLKSDKSNVIDNMTVVKEIQDSIVMIELQYLPLLYNYAHYLYCALYHYIVIIRLEMCYCYRYVLICDDDYGYRYCYRYYRNIRNVLPLRIIKFRKYAVNLTAKVLISYYMF